MKTVVRAINFVFRTTVAILAAYCLMMLLYCISAISTVYDYALFAIEIPLLGWPIYQYLRSSSTLCFTSKLLLMCAIVGFLAGFMNFMTSNRVIVIVIPVSVTMFQLVKWDIQQSNQRRQRLRQQHVQSSSL